MNEVNHQNNFNYTILESVVFDNRHHAEECGETIGTYLLRDFDASPENWNSVFEFSYDEISSKSKQERRNVLKNALVHLGAYTPEDELAN